MVVVVLLTDKIVIVVISCSWSIDTFIFLVYRNYQLHSGKKHTTKRKVYTCYFYLVLCSIKTYYQHSSNFKCVSLFHTPQLNMYLLYSTQYLYLHVYNDDDACRFGHMPFLVCTGYLAASRLFAEAFEVSWYKATTCLHSFSGMM